MAVFPLTILLGLLLAAVFVCLFLREHGRRGFGSEESTALLPLQHEEVRIAHTGCTCRSAHCDGHGGCHAAAKTSRPPAPLDHPSGLPPV